MAFYLVEAELKQDKLEKLKEKIKNKSFEDLKPFGKAITKSLENARYDPKEKKVLWEEEDYCSPPLKQEKAQVLNNYFKNLEIEKVNKGNGWKKIKNLPLLWENI